MFWKTKSDKLAEEKKDLKVMLSCMTGCKNLNLNRRQRNA